MTLEPVATASAKELRTSYETWCEVNGEKPMRPNTFAVALKARGCEARKGTGGVRVWQGVRVNDALL